MSDHANRTHRDASKPPNPPIGFGRPGPGRFFGPKVRPQNGLATIKRLWGYLGRQRSGMLIATLLTLLGSAIALIGPYLMGKAVDDYIIPKDYAGLGWLCLGMLGFYLLGSLVSWGQSYVMAGVSGRTVRELRQDVFKAFQLLPLKFFDSRPHGEWMSRATNDVENVSNSLNQSVIQLLSSVITLAGSLVMMLRLNLVLTCVSLVCIPLMLLATKKIAQLSRGYFKGQQQELGALNGFIEEMVSGQKTVKAFRREAVAIEQFQAINKRLNRVGIKAQIVSGTVGPVINFVNNVSFALIAAIGGWMAFHDWTTIGVIVSFLNYSKQFNRPINELANQYNMVQSAIAGAERVFEILDMDTEFTEEQEARVNKEVTGKVEFRAVSFGYTREKPILQQVSFTAKPGDKIALVGPTGAGKTTIVNLLTRFYDIDSGTIAIDGINLNLWEKNNLRSKLGIVLQDAYVFSGTIRENIRYGRLEATDEEVVAAAKLANADGFITRLPQGYDTILTAEGSNLSHGQRQLLTIARTILADPAILILDEATSSIDTRTEMHVQEAMKTLMKGRTSFVIAHRLNTIRDADLILVLNAGQIVEQGTHRQLLQAKGFYYQLYTSQFERADTASGIT
ncbi:ABC transporter ATP-binding protein [Brevibacillus fulvus]|uniref:ATP-binding cassette subfamily B protein n=1 Tax=Brevibacillus fulvus TaxID=1125967 RepID=A0A938Y3L4_9BACL|nr:ABC transporter ATP-binding protein [Brevibacillus fulvus]MBM7591336.1 ATP-binding cassette subfamily B protein [Brevibacillus fulvus]